MCIGIIKGVNHGMMAKYRFTSTFVSRANIIKYQRVSISCTAYWQWPKGWNISYDRYTKSIEKHKTLSSRKFPKVLIWKLWNGCIKNVLSILIGEIPNSIDICMLAITMEIGTYLKQEHKLESHDTKSDEYSWSRKVFMCSILNVVAQRMKTVKKYLILWQSSKKKLCHYSYQFCFR